jgi:hypothetical protein
MKLKLKLSLLLCAGVVFLYTACKKSSTTPSDPTLTPNAVAGQVAVNISQSLFGGLGAFDVSEGLGGPTSLAVHTKGKILNDLNNPFCGLTVDTTLKYSTAVNGGTASLSGTISFTFTCTNDKLSGYSTNDNVNISLTDPQLSFAYKVGENLVLTALNPADDNSNLSLKGSLTSNGSYQYNTGTKRSGTEIFDYTLSSIIIDPVASDVLSGSATFNTSGTGPKGVWNYQGTITFLGNQQATVTINGKTYNVNLETGVVN